MTCCEYYSRTCGNLSGHFVYSEIVLNPFLASALETPSRSIIASLFSPPEEPRNAGFRYLLHNGGIPPVRSFYSENVSSLFSTSPLLLPQEPPSCMCARRNYLRWVLQDKNSAFHIQIGLGPRFSSDPSPYAHKQERIVVSKQIQYIVVPFWTGCEPDKSLDTCSCSSDESFSTAQSDNTDAALLRKQVVQLTRSLNRSRAEVVQLKRQLRAIREGQSKDETPLKHKGRDSRISQHMPTPISLEKSLLQTSSSDLNVKTQLDETEPKDSETAETYLRTGLNDRMSFLAQIASRLSDKVATLESSLFQVATNVYTNGAAQEATVHANHDTHSKLLNCMNAHGKQLATLCQQVHEIEEQLDKATAESAGQGTIQTLISHVNKIDAKTKELHVRQEKTETRIVDLEAKQDYDNLIDPGKTAHVSYDNLGDANNTLHGTHFVMTRPSTGRPKPFWKQKVSQWDFEPLTDVTERERANCCLLYTSPSPRDS